MTTKDRAYPFPDAHNAATACVEKYGFTVPCAPALNNANYMAAMTFFLVLLSSVITKVCLPLSISLILGTVCLCSGAI